MSKDARQPLAAWRNEACAFPITIVGVDATNSTMRMQARLDVGVPGPALIELGTVTNGNAEGLRLVSVIEQDGVPVSSFQLRINKSTLQALPAYGELGDPLNLAYALQLDGSTIMHGPLAVLDSAIDSDDAADDRFPGYARLDADGATDGVVLTKLGTGVTVQIGGAAFLGAAIQEARKAIEAAAVDARASRDAAEAAQEEATTGQTLTRDPFVALREALGAGIYGDTTYTNSVLSNVRRMFVGNIYGNSLGVGQGVATIAATPLEQAKAIVGEYVPEVDQRWDNYAVPGSWQTQMGEQIDAMLAAHAAAMAPGGDGRSRIPTVALIFAGTNDIRATIYNSLQGPIVYRSELRRNIKRLQDLGTVVIVVTAPEVQATRSLASGIFDIGEPFFLTFPKTGFVAGDDKFQRLDYSKANQTITSSTIGQFKPGLYDSGLLSFDGNTTIYVPEQNKYMRLVGADDTYTILSVDDGNGGPIITEDRSTLKGFYQAKLNSYTQLVPAKNDPVTLGRAAGTDPNVPLALERRPIGPDGEAILVSVALAEINRGTREVAAQMGAILLDWNIAQRRLLTSDAVLDRLYLGGEYLHQGDEGYLLIGPLLADIIRRAMFGADVVDEASEAEALAGAAVAKMVTPRRAKAVVDAAVAVEAALRLAALPAISPAIGDPAGDTVAVQRALDTGRHVRLPEGSVFYVTNLFMRVPGQRLIGPGKLVFLKSMTGSCLLVQSYLVEIDGVAVADSPGRCIISEPGSSVKITGCDFSEIGRDFPTSGAGGSGYNAVFIGANSTVEVASCTFRNIRAAQAIRIGGANCRVSIHDNTCDTTYQRFVAIGTDIGGYAFGSIDRNTCRNIGLINDSTGVGATAIYCSGDTPQPFLSVTKNTIDVCVENGIEGPFSEISFNTLNLCGYTDTGGHPTWNTPSTFAISTYWTTTVRGNRVIGGGKTRRGINIFTGADKPIKSLRIWDNIVEGCYEWDIRVSNGTTAIVDLSIRNNDCRGNGTFLVLLWGGSAPRPTVEGNSGGVSYGGSSTPGPAAVTPANGLTLMHPSQPKSGRIDRLIQRDVGNGAYTPLFRITTAAEGGQYSVDLKGWVANNLTVNASSTAQKKVSVGFGRVMADGGVGPAPDVEDPKEGVVRGTNLSARTIGAITWSVVKVSEQTWEYGVTAAFSGSSTPQPAVNLSLSLLYFAHSTAPVLVQA